MKSLFSTALVGASILSTNALYIPDASVWQVDNTENVHHHSLQARADFVQGRCYDGQIMDPEVDQDKDEMYPVCITKKILPCPANQFPTHATATKESVCASDPDGGVVIIAPGATVKGSGLTENGQRFRSPSDKKLFYYRTAKVGNSNADAGSTPGPSSKLTSKWVLQVEERTTPATKKEMKKKAFDTSRKVQDSQKKEEEEEKIKINKIKLRKEKQRIRRSACLAVGAMTWIPEDDSNQLSDEEIEGLIEPDEEDLLVPDKDIEDYMITLTRIKVAQIESESAGWFGFINAVVKAGKAVSKSGRISGPASKILSKTGGKTGGQRFSMLRNKLGKNSAAPKKSVDAAKKSGTVKKILKDKTFKDCLKLAAKIVAKEGLKDAMPTKREDPPMKTEEIRAGRYMMTIDMNAPKTDHGPTPDEFSGNAIVIIGDEKTDAKGKDQPDMTLSTYPDNYNRQGRIPYERCMTFGGMDNKLTMLQTWGGTCAYYDDSDCKKLLFMQTNREDGQLRGKSNDAVSSAWCTFALDGKKAPGQ